MNLTLTSEDVNEPTKIKAINPHIIVGGSVEQPYYSIEYYDVEKEQFYIGYSSCYLSTVFKWLNECFDVVAGDADVIIRNLKADKDALIAGQETLQKALAKKDKEIKTLQERNVILRGAVDTQKAEIEKLKAENEILQKNADEAFQEGLNENRLKKLSSLSRGIKRVTIMCDRLFERSREMREQRFPCGWIFKLPIFCKGRKCSECIMNKEKRGTANDKP